MDNRTLISIIIPVFNESSNIESFFVALSRVLSNLDYEFEIIFINDGSTDSSQIELEKLSDSRVKVLEFSRNFGKEIALTAGLNKCTGQAALMIDSDFQHPIELIPQFIDKWRNGAEVVVGVREKNANQGFIKRLGSVLFYRVMGKISEIDLIPNATDFRLVDRQVIDEFNKLNEHNRITRGLIAWLGFQREFIYFNAPKRENGRPGYSFIKLVRLAFSSFISLSLLPLRLAGYLGVFIIFTSGPFGLYVFIGKYLANWHFAASFSGPAQLAILLTFLIGIVLSSLGLVALYVANIHTEVLGRPLYIIKEKRNNF